MFLVPVFLGALLALAAMAGLGFALLAALRLRPPGRDAWLLAAVAGAVPYGLVLWTLGWAKLVVPAAVYLLDAASLAALWRWRLPCAAQPPALPRWARLAVVACAGYCAFLYLPWALAPDSSFPATGAVHGALRQLALRRGFPVLPSHLETTLAFGGVEALYGAFRVRPASATLVSAVFLFLAAALVYAIARRSAAHAAGAFAALAILASRAFGVTAASLHTDTLALAGLLAAWLCLDFWRTDRRPAWLILAAVPLAGLVTPWLLQFAAARFPAGQAYALAYGHIFLLIPLGLLAARHAGGRRELLAAAVLAIPWLVWREPRLLLAPAPFALLALGRALAPSRWPIPALLAFHCIAAWPSVLRQLDAPRTWCLGAPPWSTALHRTPVEPFLLARVPGYNETVMLGRETQPNARVLSFIPLPDGWLDRAVWYAPAALRNPGPIEPALFPRCRQLGYTHVLIPTTEPALDAIWKNPAAWGLLQASNTDGALLFEIR